MVEQTIASLSASLASAHTSIARMQAQLKALDVRMTAVEEKPGVVPPIIPPTTKVESPDLTTLPPAAFIVDSAKRTLMVVGEKVVIDGVTLTATSGVVLLKKVDDPVNTATIGGIFQKNRADSWYGPITPTSGGAQVPGDPSLAAPILPIPPIPPVVPPSAGGVPTPAAAAGFTKRTLGPQVIIGTRPGGISPSRWGNWYPNHPGANITTNPDGSVTLAGPWDYNAQIASGDGHSFGTAFGGGGYYEFDFKWLNNYVGGSGMGWPSGWANSVEGRDIASAPAWPAGASGGYSAIEWDIFEFFADGWGPTLWDWSANGSVGTQWSPFNGAFNAQGGGRAPGSVNSYSGVRHKIGCLWVPATPTTKGRVEHYLDGTLLPGLTMTWDRFNPNMTLPLRNGSTAGSVMDLQHFKMLVGSSTANPMIVYGIEIWQRDGSANLPPT